MKPILTLLLLAGMVAAQDCDQCSDCSGCEVDSKAACDDLATARRDLKAARTEFKGLARVEQQVIREARTDIFKKTRRGQAIAPAFGAAADLLERASAEAKDDAKMKKLCAEMAASYRAMAQALDGKQSYLSEKQREQKPAARADASFRKATALVKAAGAEKATDEIKTAWSVLKKGDPRCQSLARNINALGAAFTGVEQGKCNEKVKASVANAKQLHKSLSVCFDGATTRRPPPKEALPSP